MVVGVSGAQNQVEDGKNPIRVRVQLLPRSLVLVLLRGEHDWQKVGGVRNGQFKSCVTAVFSQTTS
jgi:hypothetical protein